tara:strand:- start:67778 stop:68971 length:1194 start_codon:yes stop_codon:yes gene_type:complete
LSYYLIATNSFVTHKKPLSIYVHWPFCVSKCPYCDFNSHVRESIDHKTWLESYLKDLAYQKQFAPNHEIKSIFFGGGTPSLMPAHIIEGIIDQINKIWDVSKDVEISMEANPNSSEINKFLDFKLAGINRISLGIQSLKSDVLKFLGRAHSSQEALHAIESAQKVFKSYSLDFIYAHPKHTPQEWDEELIEILSINPPHLSLYQLTIEPQTPFQSYERLGKFKMPNEIVSEQFYDQTVTTMINSGYMHYEVSNFAKPGHACQHNMAYWQSKDYLGIGPGAHGRHTKNSRRIATRAHRSPEKWLSLVQQQGHALTHEETLTDQESLEEILLMGLRLTEGIDLKKLDQYASNGSWRNKTAHKRNNLAKEGLITHEKEKLKTTPQGLKKLNAIIEYLLID